MWRNQNSCAPLVECRNKPVWETGWWRLHQNLKIELPFDFTISLLGTSPEELKAGSWRDTCTSALMQSAARQPKGESEASIHLQMKGWIKCDIYIQWGITQTQERRKFWYMLQCGWTFEDSVLRDITQPPKKQILSDSSSMKYLEDLSFIETESRMVVPRAGGGGRGGTWSMGADFHFCEMKRVLWMDRGEDNKAMWLYLMPVRWTEKWLRWWFLYYMHFTKI